MVSTSETGHAKNVANFEYLISFCTCYAANKVHNYPLQQKPTTPLAYVH